MRLDFEPWTLSCRVSPPSEAHGHGNSQLSGAVLPSSPLMEQPWGEQLASWCLGSVSTKLCVKSVAAWDLVRYVYQGLTSNQAQGLKSSDFEEGDRADSVSCQEVADADGLQCVRQALDEAEPGLSFGATENPTSSGTRSDGQRLPKSLFLKALFF